MTKREFLETLSAELKRNNVPDSDDILEEYGQHFEFKLADGYYEEEIAAKLGKPEDIAAQYDSAAVGTGTGGGKKVITRIGLGAADFFFGAMCALLFAWEIVMCAAAVAFGVLAVSLIGAFGDFGLFSVPGMPYHCAIILGIASAAMAVLLAVGAVYFFEFIRQLMRSFGRFHSNTLAAASGRAVLPSLPVYPQFAAKARRALRSVAVFASIIFAVFLTVGFIVCVITAGSIEFWHVWNWLGYC